ncbi:MAG: LysR family transcriptional regulator, partial [Oscillospiraceae bacterium]|nr:LysR family transcriptional regulator [Oscillospiraceae bacterium]
EKLYISQPTLSLAVKDLEEELNIKIFKRIPRGVILTKEGNDFIIRARQIYQQTELLKNRYADKKEIKRTFSVSTQHYSFATKAFVEMVKKYDTSIYDFAIKETRTMEVINDIEKLSSEIGILYLSNFNRKYIMKLFDEADIEFHHLTNCDAFVYIYRKHPLAKNRSITFEELQDYPCLSFDQGSVDSLYLAEEILGENEYKRTIKTNDRATMLNLMVGLNAYTLCSGIICEELNGSDYIAVPFQADEDNPNTVMEIGYITKKYSEISELGYDYIMELKNYLAV